MIELTEDEVLKALKHCAKYKNHTVSCIDCPLHGKCDTNTLEQLSLNLILRLKAEIVEKDSKQKEAEWVEVVDYGDSKVVACSGCENQFYFMKKGQLNIDKMPYCPKCGARMKV